MPEDRHHPHPHGPPWGGGPSWGGGPWGKGRPPWWPEGEDWPPRGPEAWRGMRRHFLGRFVVILAVAVAAIVGLSALVGGFFFRGEEHRGPFFPIGLVLVVLVVPWWAGPAGGSPRRASALLARAAAGEPGDSRRVAGARGPGRVN